MTTRVGEIVGINGNLIMARFDEPVIQNEVAYAVLDQLRLKCEVVRIRGDCAELQCFEDVSGLRTGSSMEFTGGLLSVELGPGLLSKVYDGLQNPLPELAERCGFFLERGIYIEALDRKAQWDFTPVASTGDTVTPGDVLGTVPEQGIQHGIMVPFHLSGSYTVEEIRSRSMYTVEETIATLKSESGELTDVTMVQEWPVKIPISCYAEKLLPSEPLVTNIRIIDTLFPVARGGTYCIPGPFGAGKTVLQQITSKHAEVDLVVMAACGERAGEVVDTLKSFPRLTDPKTGRSLMERTVIICNTSSMPIAAREASVYTAVTVAEYYRQMGLHVLMLADSTSRWAQALRETSARLEEIPGEEAFPAYLESVISSFYERAGLVRLNNGQSGSVTIGATVSPAGGNFEEPVTQSTLKVVGAFHGLSRERSDARRYPAIDPLESWSKYNSVVDRRDVDFARDTLTQGHEVNKMMKVVGEEGSSLEDFVVFLKSEFLDATYLQQDAFHDVDVATSAERQAFVFGKLVQILRTPMAFNSKEDARTFFHTLTQVTRDWNRVAMDDSAFKTLEKKIDKHVAEVAQYA